MLPVNSPGGGANIVISESRALRRMGVDVCFFNTYEHRTGFERSYPDLEIPVFYGNGDDVPRVGSAFDAVVGTYHASIYWMQPLQDTSVIPGYYIQDYEPYFFQEGSAGYAGAKSSYTGMVGLRSFTKTEWNQRIVFEQTGVLPALVGPSVEIDQFRPRPRNVEGKMGTPGNAPLHVVGMVRPHSPRRSPGMTMRLLRQLWLRFGKRVRITLFGVDRADPGLVSLPQDFPAKMAGVIEPDLIAALLADTDIFVDFSTYQAMGLTAMEAMASGAAVIVPQNGGAASFARHEVNALIVDTASEGACWDALLRLVLDDELRQRLQTNAIHTVCRHHPERAAFQIAQTLFGTEEAPQSRPRVLVLYEYSNVGIPHGSSFIRLLCPFSYPAADSRFYFYPLPLDPGEQFELVIVDRFWRPDISTALAERLIGSIRARGAKLIYQIDDDLIGTGGE